MNPPFIRLPRISSLLIVLALAASPVLGVSAPAHSEVASGGSATDRFGASVATDAGRMAIGAPGTGAGYVNVYIADGDTWVYEATLLAPDGAVGDGFGRSIDLSGQWLAVGAPSDDNGAAGDGSVYVFRLVDEEWRGPAKVVGAPGEVGASYGIDVALDDDHLLVGAPNAGGGGRAYVYDSLVNPRLLATFEPSDTDGFGRSVDIDQGTIVVGANRDDRGAINAGAVYFYSGSQRAWSLDGILTATTPVAHSWLGTAVAISGDTAVAGAYREGSDPEDDLWAGAAYVFERLGGFWSATTRLAAPTTEAREFFGYSVDVDRNGIIIGAPAIPTGAGGAYLVARDGFGWTAAARIEGDARDGDEAGTSVALGDGLVAIGAPRGTGDDPGTSGVVAVHTSDLDSDGVMDRDEWDLGTDELNPDSDHDGLLDGAEVDLGTDPLDSDSDDDTLSDGDEVHVYESDPLNTDSDDDTFADGQEVACGSDPNDPTVVSPLASPGDPDCLLPEVVADAAP